MSYLTKEGISINVMINEKMHCLDDFGICSYDDADMRKKLRDVIKENPGKDPQQVIDYYCRPLIYNKVWSWT